MHVDSYYVEPVRHHRIDVGLATSLIILLMGVYFTAARVLREGDMVHFAGNNYPRIRFAGVPYGTTSNRKPRTRR